MTAEQCRGPYRDVVVDQVRLRWLFDAALALLIAVVGVAEIWVPFPSVLGDGSREASTVLVVVLALALAVRRRWPLAVALVVLAAWPLAFSVTPLPVLFWGQFVPMIVAVFSVARHGTRREPWYGAAAAAATLLFLDLRVEELQEPSEIVFHWLIFTIAWSVGFWLRVVDRRATESTKRALATEAAVAERTAAAIAEERARIARELHDVVAHSVSMMVVQAGAAEQVVDDDPAVARRALSTIRSTGTEALAEMRRVLTVLRHHDDGGELSPQPGVAALPALVEDARESGLDAELAVEGGQRALPAGLDLAVYRIVQEALTNVRRHAAASQVRCVLRYGRDDIEVEVHDDGRGSADPATNGGHGLIGMRERAALYGGRLETASSPGAGFTVRAILPMAPL